MTPIAPSYSPRSTRWMRSAGGDVVRPRLLDDIFRDAAAHAARALEARASLDATRTDRCAEPWTTRSTSHADSSSQCSHFVTAIEYARPCESSITLKASAAHSGSRRST